MAHKLTAPQKRTNTDGVQVISAAPTFESLPDSAFLRERDLVKQRHRPGEPVLLPFSAATLWRKVAAKEFPKPTKLGTRISAWRVADVRAWMAQQQA